jgi:hypothetical protein
MLFSHETLFIREKAKGKHMSIPPLANIEIPNTEVMRSTANFWFAAAGVHTEKAQTLETGAPFVSKNWSGRAGVSYDQTNQKVLGTGSIYQSHMFSVGELLSSTATQFDWGNTLQAAAKRQWAAATVLSSTGQVEAAALWYASARATQQTAVGVITQAYTAYTVGLKNLQAALPSKPLTSDGHAITFIPNGQPIPRVTTPAIKSLVNLPTPPLTPPPTPPLGPVPTANPTNKMQGSPNAAEILSLTPPATPPSGPVSTANPTNKMQGSPNAAEILPLTPPDTPPLGPVPTANPTNKMQGSPNAAEILSLTPPDTPPLGPVPTTDLMNVTQGSSNPAEILFNNAIVQMLLSTPEGTDALSIERAFGGKLLLVPGVASSYNPQTTTTSIGRELDDVQKARAYIHEITHLYYQKLGLTGNAKTDPLKVYVQKMLKEEINAETNAYSFLIMIKGEDELSALEKAFKRAYEQGYEQARASNPGAGAIWWHLAGKQAGKQVLEEAFANGEVRIAATGERYEEYYVRLWHIAQISPDEFVVLRPAPGDSPVEDNREENTGKKRVKRSTNLKKKTPTERTDAMEVDIDQEEVVVPVRRSARVKQKEVDRAKGAEPLTKQRAGKSKERRADGDSDFLAALHRDLVRSPWGQHAWDMAQELEVHVIKSAKGEGSFFDPRLDPKRGTVSIPAGELQDYYFIHELRQAEFFNDEEVPTEAWEFETLDEYVAAMLEQLTTCGVAGLRHLLERGYRGKYYPFVVYKAGWEKGGEEEARKRLRAALESSKILGGAMKKGYADYYRQVWDDEQKLQKKIGWGKYANEDVLTDNEDMSVDEEEDPNEMEYEPNDTEEEIDEEYEQYSEYEGSADSDSTYAAESSKSTTYKRLTRRTTSKTKHINVSDEDTAHLYKKVERKNDKQAKIPISLKNLPKKEFDQWIEDTKEDARRLADPYIIHKANEALKRAKLKQRIAMPQELEAEKPRDITKLSPPALERWMNSKFEKARREGNRNVIYSANNVLKEAKLKQRIEMPKELKSTKRPWRLNKLKNDELEQWMNKIIKQAKEKKDSNKITRANHDLKKAGINKKILPLSQLLKLDEESDRVLRPKKHIQKQKSALRNTNAMAVDSNARSEEEVVETRNQPVQTVTTTSSGETRTVDTFADGSTTTTITYSFGDPDFDNKTTIIARNAQNEITSMTVRYPDGSGFINRPTPYGAFSSTMQIIPPTVVDLSSRSQESEGRDMIEQHILDLLGETDQDVEDIEDTEDDSARSYTTQQDTEDIENTDGDLEGVYTENQDTESIGTDHIWDTSDSSEEIEASLVPQPRVTRSQATKTGNKGFYELQGKKAIISKNKTKRPIDPSPELPKTRARFSKDMTDAEWDKWGKDTRALARQQKNPHVIRSANTALKKAGIKRHLKMPPELLKNPRSINLKDMTDKQLRRWTEKIIEKARSQRNPKIIHQANDSLKKADIKIRLEIPEDILTKKRSKNLKNMTDKQLLRWSENIEKRALDQKKPKLIHNANFRLKRAGIPHIHIKVPDQLKGKYWRKGDESSSVYTYSSDDPNEDYEPGVPPKSSEIQPRPIIERAAKTQARNKLQQIQEEQWKQFETYESVVDLIQAGFLEEELQLPELLELIEEDIGAKDNLEEELQRSLGANTTKEGPSQAIPRRRGRPRKPGSQPTIPRKRGRPRSDQPVRPGKRIKSTKRASQFNESIERLTRERKPIVLSVNEEDVRSIEDVSHEIAQKLGIQEYSQISEADTQGLLSDDERRELKQLEETIKKLAKAQEEALIKDLRLDILLKPEVPEGKPDAERATEQVIKSGEGSRKKRTAEDALEDNTRAKRPALGLATGASSSASSHIPPLPENVPTAGASSSASSHIPLPPRDVPTADLHEPDEFDTAFKESSPLLMGFIMQRCIQMLAKEENPQPVAEPTLDGSSSRPDGLQTSTDTGSADGLPPLPNRLLGILTNIGPTGKNTDELDNFLNALYEADEDFHETDEDLAELHETDEDRQELHETDEYLADVYESDQELDESLQGSGGEQMPSMVETLNPPALRSVLLTPADRNTLIQMMNATMTGSIAIAAIRRFFPGGAGVPYPQVLNGGGTHYNRGSNWIEVDDLDPRPESNAVHETIHGIFALLRPWVNPGLLNAPTYCWFKLLEEAIAQTKAIQYALECFALGLPPVTGRGMVFPALTQEYNYAYEQFFYQVLIGIGWANARNVRNVYLGLNFNNRQHALLVQLVHPHAEHAGLQRVLRGIADDEVLTASTGHSYDIYYASVHDQANPLNNGLAMRGIRNWRTTRNLLTLNTEIYSYQALHRLANNEVARATNRFNTFAQAVAAVLPGTQPTLPQKIAIVGARKLFQNAAYNARQAYRKLMTAEALTGQWVRTTLNPLPAFIHLQRGSRSPIGIHILGGPVQRAELVQAQAHYQLCLTTVDRLAPRYRGTGATLWLIATIRARVALALLWEEQDRSDLPRFPMDPRIALTPTPQFPGLILGYSRQTLAATTTFALRNLTAARNTLATIKAQTRGILRGDTRTYYLRRPWRRVIRAKQWALWVYAALRVEENRAGLPLTPWPPAVQPGYRPPKITPPYTIIFPSPVEVRPLREQTHLSSLADILGLPLDQASSREPIDLTGYLRQYPNNPVSRDLRSTLLGRWALALEKDFDVKLLATSEGQGSSFNTETNAVTHALSQGNLDMQRRHMHEMFHAFAYHHGLTPDPLKLSQDVYVERKLIEEANAEVLATLHIWMLQGPLTPLQRDVVRAFRRGGLTQARQPLLDAFERGDLIPSTTDWDNTSATSWKYKHYYANQWQVARKAAPLSDLTFTDAEAYAHARIERDALALADAVLHKVTSDLQRGSFTPASAFENQFMVSFITTLKKSMDHPGDLSLPQLFELLRPSNPESAARGFQAIKDAHEAGVATLRDALWEEQLTSGQTRSQVYKAYWESQQEKFTL